MLCTSPYVLFSIDCLCSTRIHIRSYSHLHLHIHIHKNTTIHSLIHALSSPLFTPLAPQSDAPATPSHSQSVTPMNTPQPTHTPSSAAQPQQGTPSRGLFSQLLTSSLPMSSIIRRSSNAQDMTAKLQSALEEALTKNVQLQQDIDTLGKSIYVILLYCTRIFLRICVCARREIAKY